MWVEQLEEWKLQVRTTIDPIKSSSTDDDATPPLNEETEENSRERALNSLLILKEDNTTQSNNQLLVCPKNCVEKCILPHSYCKNPYSCLPMWM